MIPALEISNLAKSYDGPQGRAVIVKDFSLKIADGEFVCLIGHSGCGKSTVLSIAMGLNEASEGGVIIAGREVDGPGLDRGVVFQSSALLPWLTARQNVSLAIDQVSQSLPARARRSLAEKYLSAVGLDGVADSFPDELSAGMRQRVGIARAFAVEPRVLLLDEPFSLLDVVTRMELQDQLIQLCARENKTVLMVTHDVDEALLLADRVVMMTNGPAATVGEIVRVPFERPRDRLTLLDDPRYHPVRQQLLSFLEERAQRTAGAPATMAPLSTEQSHVRVSPEELFVIEKYSGFNRFRARYRNRSLWQQDAANLLPAKAKAIS